MYLLIVEVLAILKSAQNTMHEEQDITSLSAFSLLRASIAAISLIDSSTLPCSPKVSIFSVPPCIANSISAISRIWEENQSEGMYRIDYKLLLYQVGRLGVLLGSLLESSVSGANPPVALIHEREYVRFVFHLESRKDGVAWIRLSGLQKLGLQTFSMGLWTSS